MGSTGDASKLSRRHRNVGVICAGIAGVMVGATYAAVPLYDLFCRATGFGGRPQTATSAPGIVLDRSFEVRFDANVNAGLPWRFEPEERSVSIKVGEVRTVLYRVTNQSDSDTYGVASYNVTPEDMGAYFTKISCFCFSQQRLKAGETLELPVVFFIDPDIARQSDFSDISTITLSYTFFAAKPPSSSVAKAETR